MLSKLLKQHRVKNQFTPAYLYSGALFKVRTMLIIILIIMAYIADK